MFPPTYYAVITDYAICAFYLVTYMRSPFIYYVILSYYYPVSIY